MRAPFRAGIPSLKNSFRSQPVLELSGSGPPARSELPGLPLRQKLHSPHSYWLRSDYSDSLAPDLRSIHLGSIRRPARPLPRRLRR